MSDAPCQNEEDPFLLESIQHVLNGNVEAFSAVVNTFQRLVAADLSRRLPAQDIQEVAQDTFIRVFRALPAYRGDAPLRIWILRIARRAAMDFWRKHYRRRERLLFDLDESEQTRAEATRQAHLAEQQADRAAQENARDWLKNALRQLSPDDRAVITLVELEDCTMEEAAQNLGCSLTAVKVRAFRARRRLRGILEALRPGKEEEK